MRLNFKNKIFTLEFATGILFIGAVLIIVYFTTLVNGRNLLFGPTEFEYQAEFPNAGALALNDKVKVIGVEMGYVAHIALTENNKAVLVRMRIRKNIKFPIDTAFTIQNSSVFGGAYINIVPGRSVRIADPETVFKGFPPVDIIAEASTLIAALKEDEVKLRENILNDEFIRELKDALRGIQSNSASLNEICSDIQKGKGSLGKLMTDNALYNDAQSSFSRINTLLGNLENGKGTLGRLFKEEEGYDLLISTFKDIKKLTEQIASGKSSLGKLTTDSGEIYHELRASVDAANRILASIEAGKGSAGKILTDDELYREIKDTVRQLRAAIEDFREMAPVATFGSIAFGAL